MAKKRRGQSAAFMRSINPYLHRGRSKNKRGQSAMVRHRRVRRVGRRSRSSSGKQSLMKMLLIALGYGVVRNPIANFTAPMVSKVINTAYNDHIGNGVLAFAAMKFGSGMIKEAGKVALIAEVASAGTGFNFANLTGQASSSQGYVFN